MIVIERKVQSRIFYIDILRIISVFAVIVLHISAPFTANLNHNGLRWWWVGNIFNSATRWCVPVLILISGRLMLNSKEEEIVPFLKKRISKIIIPLVFWSFIYFLLVNKSNFQWNSSFIISFFKNLYVGDVHIHLWYLYMIVGLYLITPVIKPYVNSAKMSNLIYFVIVWFVSNGIIGFSEKFTGYKLAFNLSFFHWSIGYFILGFILDKYKFSKSQKRIVYVLGFIGLIVTIFGTYILTKHNEGVLVEHLYSYYAPNVIFTSIAIFLIVKNIDWDSVIGNNVFARKLIQSLSNTSFGIYLIHLLVLRVLSSGYIGITINASLFNPLISIPLVSTITFVLSHFIVMILQKVPLLNKIVPK